MGIRENFHILGAKWRILRPFSGGFFAYLSLSKVLRSGVNRFWKNLSVALSDDSVALWTAALQERNAERQVARTLCSEGWNRATPDQ